MGSERQLVFENRESNVGMYAGAEAPKLTRIAPWSTMRVLDLTLVVVGAICFAIPMALIAIALKVFSRGPVLHWALRIGRDNRPFRMPKFRTMIVGTPLVAAHLLKNAPQYVTWPGRFLRKFSLDELPQLYCIAKGDVRFVGPRPALYNQDDLLELRTQAGVHRAVPGLTGWAQVNGRETLSTVEKVKFDTEYVERQSLLFDLKILALTVLKVALGTGVTH